MTVYVTATKTATKVVYVTATCTDEPAGPTPVIDDLPKPEEPEPQLQPKPQPKAKVPQPQIQSKPKQPKPETELQQPETEQPETELQQQPKTEQPESEQPELKKTSGGKYWSITYSPYSNNRQCKGAAEVSADIADIASKGFENVRIYSTDCSGLENVGNACAKHGLGIIAGIFIEAGGLSTADEQLADLKKWKLFGSLVRAVVVGNEAVFNGFCSAADLAGYISRVRAELRAAQSYTGPVTTTETLNILQANGPTLCAAMDFVGVNVQPYFDGGVTADQAGTFLASQLKLAEGVCNGKKGYVLEAGWPSGGMPNGKAVASPENQSKAINSYKTAVPGRISFFSYQNDGWKEPGNLGIETHFGCSDAF